jgi:nitrogen fixation/metabolism regulation signal transduction histidine kinase
MITALVLLVSLLGSLLISRGIVARVSRLMEEQQRAAAKLRDLSALKNWQAVARVLVHELKAPVTPIKLIATDLERKYNSLTPEAFGRYVEDAQKLLAEQVVAIETMIEGFTRFGRLPAPNRRRTNLADFLRDFSSNYGEAFGPGVRLSVTSMAHDMLVDMDAKLMRDLLFNLCKNAGEANHGDTEITMAMTISTTGSGASVEVRNTGAIISEELQDSVFEPYVSTKHDLEKSNMGLGLTIAKKIALDHGGDLILVRDKTFAGTIFRMDLPSAKAAEEKSTGSEETLS